MSDPSLILPLDDFSARLPPVGRLMSLDVGTKTIGVAISDMTRLVASGLETRQRTKFTADAEHLQQLVKQHRVCGVIVGLPISLDGTAGPRVQSITSFARMIAPMFGLPLLLWDERFSTVAAEKALLEADTSRRRRKEVIDKVAAVIILQGALERLRFLRQG